MQLKLMHFNVATSSKRASRRSAEHKDDVSNIVAMCQAADAPQEAVSINSLPTGALHLIFSFLSARDLATCTAVCRVWRKLNRDKASNSLWKGFYTNRWRVTGTASNDVCWQGKYGRKMKQVSVAVEALVWETILHRIRVAGLVSAGCYWDHLLFVSMLQVTVAVLDARATQDDDVMARLASWARNSSCAAHQSAQCTTCTTCNGSGQQWRPQWEPALSSLCLQNPEWCCQGLMSHGCWWMTDDSWVLVDD
jgi:hypothetical protein